MKTKKEKQLADALRNNLLKRKQQKRDAGENASRYRKKNIGVSSLLDKEKESN
jgi:hypothetical protein